MAQHQRGNLPRTVLNEHPFLAGTGTLLMAHRGGGAEVAENSFSSLHHVVSLGLTYVETDARTTSDGVAVLLHDPTLARTTGVPGAISDYTWAELERIKDHSGGRHVRVEEAVEAFPSLKFNVDAKTDAAVEPLAALATRFPERVGLASFSDSRLARMRDLAPEAATSAGQREVAVVVLASRLPLTQGIAIVRRHAEGLTRATSLQVPPTHRGIPVVTPRFVRVAHALELAVHVWDADRESTRNRMLEAGADGLITDYPTAARDYLDKRGGWR